MFETIYNWFLEAIQALVSTISSVLPHSPFVSFIDNLTIPYIEYVNWLVPIGTFIKIGAAWLVSIGLFYAYSFVLRWIKAIE